MSTPRGMSFDRASIPADLKEPAMEAGQPPDASGTSSTGEQPRTDSKADDPLGELRWELGARTRQLDQVRKDYRALTEEVITALSTGEHHMTMRGGLPFCECGLPLAGGDASGSFITHILATTTRRTAPWARTDGPPSSSPPSPSSPWRSPRGA